MHFIILFLKKFLPSFAWNISKCIWRLLLWSGLLMFALSVVVFVLEYTTNGSYRNFFPIHYLSTLYIQVRNHIFFTIVDEQSFMQPFMSIGYFNLILSSLTFTFGKKTFGLLTEYMIKDKFGKIENFYFYICIISVFFLFYAKATDVFFLFLCQLFVQSIGILVYINILIFFLSSIGNSESSVIRYIDSLFKSLRRDSSSQNMRFIVKAIENLAKFLQNSISKGESKNWKPLIVSIAKLINNFSKSNCEILLKTLLLIWRTIFLDEKGNINTESFMNDSYDILFETVYEIDIENQLALGEYESDDFEKLAFVYATFATFIAENIDFRTYQKWVDSNKLITRKKYRISRNIFINNFKKFLSLLSHAYNICFSRTYPDNCSTEIVYEKNKEEASFINKQLLSQAVLYAFFAKKICKNALERDYEDWINLFNMVHTWSRFEIKKDDNTELSSRIMTLSKQIASQVYGIEMNLFDITEINLLNECSQQNKYARFESSNDNLAEKLQIIFDFIIT